MVFDRPGTTYDGTIDVGGFSYPGGHAAGAAALGTKVKTVLRQPVRFCGRS
jgi:membrane-associated phospholipid phosphatase